jgi:Caspase domain
MDKLGKHGTLNVAIIGNTNYAFQNNLPGCKEDVNKWKPLMESIGKKREYPDQNIHVNGYFDQTAPQMRDIIAELLSPQMKPGAEIIVSSGAGGQEEGFADTRVRDTRVLIFSGHGTLIDVRQGLQIVGGVQVLTTAGFSNAYCGINTRQNSAGDVEDVLADDTLQDLVAAAYFASKIYIILDCCHSGDSGKQLGVTVRGFTPRNLTSTQKHKRYQAITAQIGAAAVTTGFVPYPSRHRGLFLEACEASETAKDSPAGGVFSLGLEAKAEDGTPAQMKTNADVTCNPKDMHPQLEDLYQGLKDIKFADGLTVAVR